MTVIIKPLSAIGSPVVTVFRDSFNRSPQVLGVNWDVGSKPGFPFVSGNVVTATAVLANQSVGGTCGGGLNSILSFGHTAPTFNPAWSWNMYGLPVKLATSALNGKSQFSAMKLCITSRTGGGDIFVGPSLFLDTSVQHIGACYALSVRASTHGWFLDKVPTATLASGAGIVDGDVLSLELTVNSVGNVTLVARQNSSILATVVDAAAYTVGYPGFFASAQGQNSGTLISEWANYIGGLGPLQSF